MAKKLKAAILGFGGMGHCHASQYAAQKNVTLAALCDIDPGQLKKTDITINIGNSGKTDTKDIAKYLSYEELIANEKDLDYIDICLPSDLHCEYSVRAMNDGFNVLCEKPMALNTADCDKMIAASKATGKLLMIAQCLRFDNGFAVIKKAIEEKTYGKLLRMSFQRMGGLPNGWFRDVKRSGGALLDLHLHDLDFMNYALGVPDELVSTGCVVYSGGLDDTITLYTYKNGLTASSEGSWARPSWTAACVAIFEQGTLELKNNVVMLFQPDKKAKKIPVRGKTNPYFNEIAYFADCLKRGLPVERALPESTRESIRIIALEEQSAFASGKRMKVK